MELYKAERYAGILSECFATNRQMSPKLLKLNTFFPDYGGKYVGCVHYKTDDEVCLCINNSAQNTLLYYPNEGKSLFINALTNLFFSYTGGIYNSRDNCIYGIPRNANNLLRINLSSLEIDTIKVLEDDDLTCNNLGHHYCGKLINNFLYCIPRLESYILVIDMDNFQTDRIYHEIFKTNNYNGAVLHPNGNLYFTPMQGSIMAMFNPKTNDISLIGSKNTASMFGGTVHPDGNIYIYGNDGLYCVDVNENILKLIFNETSDKCIIFDSYGTILHYNGKIYNIPGTTPYFYEFDPEQMICRTVFTFHDGRYSQYKWAGGSLLENGNIFLVPAFGRFAAEVVFDQNPVLEDDMRSLIYNQILSPL